MSTSRGSFFQPWPRPRIGPAEAETGSAAATLRNALLLAMLCLALQGVSIGYSAQFQLGASPASLAHLQWGVLLAVAMLAQARVYLRVAYLAIVLGWCMRVMFQDPAGGPVTILIMLPLYAAMYGWTVLCVRWMGWPRQPGRRRVRQDDILPFAGIGLILYPLGWGLGYAVLMALLGDLSPAALLDFSLQTGFARFFGVLCLTLPIVLYRTGRLEPAPLSAPMPAWERWLMAGYAVAIAVIAMLLAGPDPHTAPAPRALLATVLDLRFMLAGLAAWMVLRLPWRWSAPLMAATNLLLIFAVAARTRSGLEVGGIELLQVGLELIMLQQLLLLTLVMARDNRRSLQRVVDESRRDGLSGIPNINALRHDLARDGDRPGEIGCLSIERVDAITASLGLSAQDAIAAAVHRHLQPDIHAYTLGAGRFALLPGAGRANWGSVLRRLERFEFSYAGAEIRVEPYLGVCALGADDCTTPDAALHAAHEAMQQARQRGEMTPQHVLGPTDCTPVRDALRTHSMALSLLRQGRVELHVQTIRSLSGTGQADMGEVLCRLCAPDGTLVMPMDFIPGLEASRGVIELDRAVITSLLAWMRAHPGDGGRARLAVNLSGHSLASEHFRGWLLDQLDAFPGSSERLCFELTERSLAGSFARARLLLDGLAGRGSLVALDDFGTGTQSFERLQQLPIDLIKIDGTFISNIVSSRRDRDLVRAMVSVARAYGAQTVAEYVADEQTLATVRELGVDWAQGFHIARPRPLAEDPPA